MIISAPTINHEKCDNLHIIHNFIKTKRDNSHFHKIMHLNNTGYLHMQSDKYLYLSTTTLDQMSPTDPSQTIS